MACVWYFTCEGGEATKEGDGVEAVEGRRWNQCSRWEYRKMSTIPVKPPAAIVAGLKTSCCSAERVEKRVCDTRTKDERTLFMTCTWAPRLPEKKTALM